MARALPGPLATLAERAFLSQLTSTPRGRASILAQVARSEGSDGENGVFDHILATLDDEEVKKLVRVHQQDEVRHEQMFLERMRAQGEAPVQTPVTTELLTMIDKHTGFKTKPVNDRHDVVNAYLMLQVIEERALHQFTRMIWAFEKNGDKQTADVFREVAKDEDRHLKYCVAITKKFSRSEVARTEALRMMRAVEQAAFEETQRVNFHVFVNAGLVQGRVWRFLLDKVEEKFGAPQLAIA